MTTSESFLESLDNARKELEEWNRILEAATASHKLVHDTVRCIEELRECCRMPTFGGSNYFKRFLVREYEATPAVRVGTCDKRLTSVRGLIVKDLVKIEWGITREQDRNEDYFYRHVLKCLPDGADVAFGALAEAAHEPCAVCDQPAPLTVVCYRDEETMRCGTWIERLCLRCPTVTRLAYSGGYDRSAPFATKTK